MICPNCSHIYPISNGIPNMVRCPWNCANRSLVLTRWFSFYQNTRLLDSYIPAHSVTRCLEVVAEAVILLFNTGLIAGFLPKLNLNDLSHHARSQNIKTQKVTTKGSHWVTKKQFWIGTDTLRVIRRPHTESSFFLFKGTGCTVAQQGKIEDTKLRKRILT